METKQEAHTILAKIEAHSRQQLLFTKILCILCALAVVCSLVVMITVSQTASALTALVKPIQELTGQAEVALRDISDVASKLAQADFTGMVNQIDSLATDSQAAVAEAVKKMDTIDIDALNKAIKDLAAIVEPLAKVGKIFG